MSNKVISVIIPVYNIEKYLVRCLESIIKQTYPFLEIICINDGSTDGSLEIIRKYQKEDNRIKVIDQKNAGSSAARNAGLDVCTGEYFTFVDGDDWLELDMYETLIKMMDTGADITACGYFFNYPTKEEVACNKKEAPESIQDIRDFLVYIYCRDEYKGVASYIWNKLFNAELINGKKAKIRFDKELGSLGDDIWFAAQCYMLEDKIIYTPVPKYHYMQRCDSEFQQSLGKRLDTLYHVKAYENIINLFQENNIKQEVMDYVIRFYVYHVGVLLEYAYKICAEQVKIEVLKEKIHANLDVYKRCNLEHPDRVKWIEDLLNNKDTQKNS